MTYQHHKDLKEFLDILGLKEEPVGIFHTDIKPSEGFSPKSMDLPTREKEINNEIDWQATFGHFSCVLGHIWRARKKKTVAYFTAEQFACPGGAFFLGLGIWQRVRTRRYWEGGIPRHVSFSTLTS